MSRAELIVRNAWLEEIYRQVSFNNHHCCLQHRSHLHIKGDGGLRFCIGYQDIDSKMVINQYHLPLIPGSMNILHEASIYTNLYVWKSYNWSKLWKAISISYPFELGMGGLNPQLCISEHKMPLQIATGMIVMLFERPWTILHRPIWMTFWYIPIQKRNMWIMLDGLWKVFSKLGYTCDQKIANFIRKQWST